MTDSRLLCLLVAGCAVALGCSNSPSRVAAPSWRPEQFADEILAKLDANSDQLLDEQELRGAPGLAYGARHIDKDGDRMLSRDELVSRFEMYRQSKLAVKRKDFVLKVGSRPLGDAKIRLEPEFFLSEVLETASDTSFPDGSSLPQTAGLDLPGMRPGYYRVVVEEAPGATLSPAYSSAETTPIGVEVSPFSDGGTNYGALLLQFNSK